MMPSMGRTAAFILWGHQGNPISKKEASIAVTRK